MRRIVYSVLYFLLFVNLFNCSSGIKLQFHKPSERSLIGVKHVVIAPCLGSEDAASICNYLALLLKQNDYFSMFDRNKFSSILEQNDLTYEKVKQLDSLGQLTRLPGVDGIIFSELKSIEILPDELGSEQVEKSVWTGEYERDELGQIIEEIGPSGEKIKKKKYKLQIVDQHFRVRKAKMHVIFQLIDLNKSKSIIFEEIVENYSSNKIIKEESQQIPTDDEIKTTLVHHSVEKFFKKISPRTITVRRVIEKGTAAVDSGIVFAKAGHWSEAQQLWNEAQKTLPTDARVQYNLGLAAEAQGNYYAAEIYYKKASLLNPKKKLYQKAVQNIKKVWQEK